MKLLYNLQTIIGNLKTVAYYFNDPQKREKIVKFVTEEIDPLLYDCLDYRNVSPFFGCKRKVHKLVNDIAWFKAEIQFSDISSYQLSIVTNRFTKNFNKIRKYSTRIF